MPKSKIDNFSIWKQKKMECISIAKEIEKNKELIFPIMYMIMNHDHKKLYEKYQAYLSKKYPLEKLSSDNWLHSFVDDWLNLQKQENKNKLMLKRLNGIADKNNKSMENLNVKEK